MAIPFYNSIQAETIKEGPSRTFTVASAKSSKIQPISEFSKKLALFEKGQLTVVDDKFENIFNRNSDKLVVPHREMPWFLYRESYRRIPLVYNAINNTGDFALQAGFELDASDDAKNKILKWFDEVNFELILLNIFKQMQIFGNAYLDISDLKFPKLLSPEKMHVVVQRGGANDGKLIGYLQINDIDPKKNVEFSPEELIHFKWNDTINPFYGMSEIHPALGAITRYENWMLDLGEILHRYAAPIIHWIVGVPEYPATQDQIDGWNATVENRLPGEDLTSNAGISHEIVGASTKMMQVDSFVKGLENSVIAALRIPEVFARGGESSNKATAQIELEAFDRKVKAIQKAVSFMLEDLLFSKLTKGDVKLVWNEFSAEGELIRAQRIQFYVSAGIPVEIALKMSGLGTWVDDVKKAREEEEKKQQEQMQQFGVTQIGGKPGQKPIGQNQNQKPPGKPAGGEMNAGNK